MLAAVAVGISRAGPLPRYQVGMGEKYPRMIAVMTQDGRLGMITRSA